MTRPVPKAVPFFPDWQRVLRRAERVETVPVRRCEICDTDGSTLMEMKTLDGWVCVDTEGCGRRENAARRVR